LEYESHITRKRAHNLRREINLGQRNICIQKFKNLEPLQSQPTNSKFSNPIYKTIIHTYNPNVQGGSAGNGHGIGNLGGHVGGGGGGSGANIPTHGGFS